MTGPSIPKDDLREAAEKAACALLDRPLDRVVARSFAFMPAPLWRPDELAVRWTEIWEPGPPPPDMISFTVTYPDPFVGQCVRWLSRRETFNQAPEILDFINGCRADEQRLKALFA